MEFALNFAFIKTAFVTLMVAIDPPGLIPIFLTLTAAMTPTQRASTARRAVLIAFGVLVATAVCGQPVLNALGISIPAFRIAGGLLLFYIAFEMVFERREQRKNQSAEEALNEPHFEDIAAFPLAVPLIAGPGAITATILQASAAGNWVNMAALMGILAVIVGSCYVVFRLSTVVNRALSESGRVIFTRLMGVILAAMAIQIVGDGVMAFK